MRRSRRGKEDRYRHKAERPEENIPVQRKKLLHRPAPEAADPLEVLPQPAVIHQPQDDSHPQPAVLRYQRPQCHALNLHSQAKHEAEARRDIHHVLYNGDIHRKA